ncbi:MAG TPA: hypothetical protein VLG44_03910 [Chlamydiales bacterium]|nr:hypothetical protein [Chlamydiales bacterium]
MLTSPIILPAHIPNAGSSTITTELTSSQQTSTRTIAALIQKPDQAQALFHYFLNEIELDAQISREEQDAKIQEFKTLTKDLSPEVASVLTTLLLEETRTRIIDILQNAGLEEPEIKAYLADNDQAVQRVQNMDVETARQMLFFVAELKIHRQYVI